MKHKALITLQESGYTLPEFFILSNDLDLQKIVLKDTTPYILRSSFSIEDGQKRSFAGVFQSFFPLFHLQDIQEKFIEMQDLKHNEVYQNYISLHDMQDNAGEYCAILQEFIIGDFSGVCFTQSNDNLRIEIVPGLNFSLLDSHVRAPFWIEISRTDKQIHDFGWYGEDFFYTLREDKVQKVEFKLHDFEENIFLHYLDDMVEKFLGIEKLFGIPQDIEFTYKGDILYILQSRNITS